MTTATHVGRSTQVAALVLEGAFLVALVVLTGKFLWLLSHDRHAAETVVLGLGVAGAVATFVVGLNRFWVIVLGGLLLAALGVLALGTDGGGILRPTVALLAGGVIGATLAAGLRRLRTSRSSRLDTVEAVALRQRMALHASGVVVAILTVIGVGPVTTLSLVLVVAAALVPLLQRS